MQSDTRPSIGAWPLVALAAALLLFYRKILLEPSKYTIPWDFQYYHRNTAGFLASSLQHRSLPLWDPYTYCGLPFFANLQAQGFYPPAWLTAMAANLTGEAHLGAWMAWCLAAHLLLAGCATYWLLRELRCGKLAALVGALAFELGCYFASQAQHLGAVEGGTWLPVASLAVVKLARAGPPRWAVALACSLAASILAGFPSAAGAVWLCSLLLVCAFIVTRHAPARLGAHWTLAAAVAFALAGVQLLPSLEAASLSVSKYRSDWRGTGSGTRLEALPSLLYPDYFHILDLRGYRLPYNLTFLYLYCGLATLGLALWALIRRPPFAIPFGLVTLASGFLMLGDATRPGRWTNPYFLAATHDTFYPEYLMLGFSFGVSVLAGLGAQQVRAKPFAMAALVVFTTIDLTYWGSSRPMNTKSLQEEPGVTSLYFDGSLELLETVRGLVRGTQPPWRVDTVKDSPSWSHMAATTGVPTAGGDDPMALERYMSVRRIFTGGERWGRYYEVARIESPVLDLLNVRYLIATQPTPDSPKWRLVAKPPAHLVYENSGALPRFFVVRHTLEAASLEDAVSKMQSAGFDPAHVAVVEGLPPSEYLAGGTDGVRVVRYEPNQVTLDVDAERGGFLVSSEANYPGWRAEVDGKYARIYHTNGAFRGLALSEGRHRVVFSFRPSILWWGMALSVVGLIAAVGIWRWRF